MILVFVFVLILAWILVGILSHHSTALKQNLMARAEALEQLIATQSLPPTINIQGNIFNPSKIVRTKKEVEDILNLFGNDLVYKWDRGVIQYQFGRLDLAPHLILNKYRVADVVLIAAHEILAHHMQRFNLFQTAASKEKEAMDVEGKVLDMYGLQRIKNEWKLMRLVRAMMGQAKDPKVVWNRFPNSRFFTYKEIVEADASKWLYYIRIKKKLYLL